MSKDKSIQIRIEADFKAEVEEILSELGLSTSQAVAMFLRQVKMLRGLPFDVRIPHQPNKLTRETLEKSRRGEELTEYDTLDEMFESWDKA